MGCVGVTYTRTDAALDDVIQVVNTRDRRTNPTNEVILTGSGAPEVFGFGATQAERDAEAAAEIVDRVLGGDIVQHWDGDYRDGAWT